MGRLILGIIAAAVPPYPTAYLLTSLLPQGADGEEARGSVPAENFEIRKKKTPPERGSPTGPPRRTSLRIEAV